MRIVHWKDWPAQFFFLRAMVIEAWVNRVPRQKFYLSSCFLLKRPWQAGLHDVQSNLCFVLLKRQLYWTIRFAGILSKHNSQIQQINTIGSSNYEVGMYVHPPTVTVPRPDPVSFVAFHAIFSHHPEDPNDLASIALNRACVILVKHAKKVQEFPSAQQKSVFHGFLSIKSWIVVCM